MLKDGQFYWRYFRVTDPVFNQKLQDLENQRVAVTKQWDGLARSYGASLVKTWTHNGDFAGFVLDGEACPKTFRMVGKLAVPKKNTTEGQAVWKLIKAIPKVLQASSVLADYGLEWSVPLYTVDGLPKYASVVGFYDEGIWFVKVPSRHFDDASLEALKSVKEETGSVPEAYKHALWQPPAAWLQIKNWEFVREWDELELIHS